MHERAHLEKANSSFKKATRASRNASGRVGRVRDLSVGGLFIETLKVCPADATVKLHFLVEDGEITADATVRYVKAGSGLGLKFKTVRTEDQPRFAAMIRRLILPG